LLLIFLLAGCSAPKVIFHPIDKEDIVRIEKGTKIGDWTTDRNGYFLSDEYMKDVMEAKVLP